jgi:uncharacterized protein YjbJ (UPF0337 family)
LRMRRRSRLTRGFRFPGREGLGPLAGPEACVPGSGGNGERWWAMGAQSDQVKGRAKEAAGVLTGNEDLEAEGKTDRLTGEAEEKIDHAKDKVDEVVNKTKDALHLT